MLSGGSGSYVAAAVVNAVWLLRGKEKALAAKEQVVDCGLSTKNLKSCRDWMAEYKMGVTTLVVTDERRDEDSWYGLLTKQRGGVFLARTYETGVVDHAIVVDCRRKGIYDSAEKWPLELSEDALEACGGDEAVRPRIIEVREVVIRGQE